MPDDNRPGLGFRQAGSLDLLEAIRDGAAVTEEQRGVSDRKRATRARAYAQTCHSLGIREDQMTDSQKGMAEAMVKRWEGARTGQGKVGGFRIDPSGRDPQVR
jgi:hypothetical protein